MLDKDATKQNILAVLNHLAGQPVQDSDKFAHLPKVGPEDVVMIYFAGHGTTRKQHFYMLPHDIGYKGSAGSLDEAGLAIITKNSVSDREPEAALESVDAGQMLLFINACNSGQALGAAEKRRGPMNARDWPSWPMKRA